MRIMKNLNLEQVLNLASSIQVISATIKDSEKIIVHNIVNRCLIIDNSVILEFRHALLCLKVKNLISNFF